MNIQKVDGYSRPESTMNQFNIITIYTIFTQQWDTNSIQVLIIRRYWNISEDIKQGGKFHGLKVLQS